MGLLRKAHGYNTYPCHPRAAALILSAEEMPNGVIPAAPLSRDPFLVEVGGFKVKLDPGSKALPG